MVSEPSVYFYGMAVIHPSELFPSAPMPIHFGKGPEAARLFGRNLVQENAGSRIGASQRFLAGRV